MGKTFMYTLVHISTWHIFYLDVSICIRDLRHTAPHIRPISCHVTSLPWQKPEEELNKLLLLTKVSDRDQNAKVKKYVRLRYEVMYIYLIVVGINHVICC